MYCGCQRPQVQNFVNILVKSSISQYNVCICVLSCWLNVCGGHVEICEILLRWFQKKVDQQKNGKTYFWHIYEYFSGVWNCNWLVCFLSSKMEIWLVLASPCSFQCMSWSLDRTVVECLYVCLLAVCVHCHGKRE